MRPTFQSGESAERGYTLLELLVVLVVAGLLTAAVSSALPSARTPSPDQTAIKLVSAIRASRNAAIRTGAAKDFEISLNGRAFRALEDENTLPSDIELTVTLAQELKNGEWAIIRFYPDGASSGAQIVVARGDMRSEIIVNWLTGRIDHAR